MGSNWQERAAGPDAHDTRAERPLLSVFVVSINSLLAFERTLSSPGATVVDLGYGRLPSRPSSGLSAYVRSILASRWLVSSATQSVWRQPRCTHVPASPFVAVTSSFPFSQESASGCFAP